MDRNRTGSNGCCLVESVRNVGLSCVAVWRDGFKDADKIHRGYKAPLKSNSI
jgi:hypothetical protein